MTGGDSRARAVLLGLLALSLAGNGWFLWSGPAADGGAAGAVREPAEEGSTGSGVAARAEAAGRRHERGATPTRLRGERLPMTAEQAQMLMPKTLDHNPIDHDWEVTDDLAEALDMTAAERAGVDAAISSYRLRLREYMRSHSGRETDAEGRLWYTLPDRAGFAEPELKALREQFRGLLGAARGESLAVLTRRDRDFSTDVVRTRFRIEEGGDPPVKLWREEYLGNVLMGRTEEEGGNLPEDFQAAVEEARR
ncbi:MAG: hypothetical protein JWO82_2696 [Akkermansiaceae bacterium]|nr:hypothetical protein [Akkermansiaceae bacterium]